MAHWAEIDDNNIVLRVVVTTNEGDEGYQWLLDNLGGQWVKTSYNTIGNTHREGGTPFRKNYAGIGYTYDETRDAFIAPKPPLLGERDWVLDEETCTWVLPIIDSE